MQLYDSFGKDPQPQYGGQELALQYPSSVQSPPIVVMGVSAVGKTSVGKELARLLGASFLDADDLHSEENIAKMRAGVALTDDDRELWLNEVGRSLVPGTVVACSALKRKYRDVLRRHAPDLVFLHLDATPDRLLNQAIERIGHFMPSELLPSQLAMLEPLQPDERGYVIQVDDNPTTLARRSLAALGELNEIYSDKRHP